jgi:ATP adenylyltransferase
MPKAVWAPWRMDYILSEKAVGCIFCDQPRQHRDPENHILWRGDTAFVVLNRYPYSNGHLMVVPYTHAPSLTELDASQRAELMELTATCEAVLRQALHPDGLNLGMNLGSAAGAGIAEHLHMHVVPRWHGDSNYMTVVGDIRVIPQHIDQTYQILVPHFQTLCNQTSRA